jgi:hypothetical protein
MKETKETKETKERISLDKFLSFWIVLYSIGYVLKIFHYNPIILLGLSIIVFVAAVIIALYYYNKNSNLFYYFVINFLAKIPLFIMIYNNNPGMKHGDIIFSVLIILIYILYIKAVDDDILCIYRDLLLFIINKEDGRESPFYKYYKDLNLL